MSFEWSKPIAAYFDAAAPAYSKSIDPVFRPLARELVSSSDIHPDNYVLDLGTGTGLVAESASLISKNVIGIDFSPSMLQLARKTPAITWLRGDLHSIPLQSDKIDFALASFAFNSTDPVRALAETHRVLQIGGRLHFQEWAETDELSELISDLFAEYMVDDPPLALDRFREQMQHPIPWDDLESVAALETMLDKAGFRRIDVKYVSPSVVLPSAESFIQYKLAWPIRAAELEAMPPEIRAICINDLKENLSPYVERGTGRLIWEPNLVRISAEK